MAAVAVANTSIKLGANQLKKDAVFETLDMTPCTAREVGVWARANIVTNKPQNIIGTFEVLARYAFAYLKKASDGAPIAETIFHVPLGGTESDITVDGVPTADECSLHIGTELVINEESHFIDRCVKRLKEAWLEGPP